MGCLPGVTKKWGSRHVRIPHAFEHETSAPEPRSSWISGIDFLLVKQKNCRRKTENRWSCVPSPIGSPSGFPSAPGWDHDCLAVSFNELLPDDSIEETSETIDNLPRSVHALSICEHRHAILLRCQSPSALWERREEAFLNLIFGPDVKIEREFLGLLSRS